MEQWYYTKNGQQQGPVSLGQLRDLIGSGSLNPATDLVWNPSMTDWLRAAEVPVLTGTVPTIETTTLQPTQPFAYPTATGAFVDIVPGSEPVIATACVKRAFDLTVKHIGPILLVTIIFVAISILVSTALQALDTAIGWAPTKDFFTKQFGATPTTTSYQFNAGNNNQLSFPSSVISNIINVFFMLGATRVGLRIVDGKPFDVGMLFSGGRFLFKGFIAYIIYMVMIVIGLVLLIVPGIIVLLRFGMYQNAIVDRNMGIIESLGCSWNLTKGNGLNLFLIVLFSIGIVIAGCIALIVGMLFAYPMIWLMWIVAYRWLQYGGRAVLDDPMTQKPLLAQLPD